MSYFNPLQEQFKQALLKIGLDAKVNKDTYIKVILKQYSDRIGSADYTNILTERGATKAGDLTEIDNIIYLVEQENITANSVYSTMIMRRTNFDIKFIVDNRLFQYPSIIESENAYIADSNLMAQLKHTLTATLPLTAITRELKIEQSFIKWGQKWQVQGRDYTKNGLVILTCERIATSHNDDMENEIADRYIDDVDKLNGNIVPLLPFDTIATEIISVQSFNNIEVEFDTPLEDIELPKRATVTLNDTTTTELNIVWDTSTYIKDVAGVYIIYGTLQLIEGIANTNNIKAQIKIAVDEEIEEGAIYEIEVEKRYVGDTDFELWSNGWQKYTIKKLVGDTEMPGNFDFALGENIGGLTLTKESNNICKLSSVTIYGKYNIQLIVTDIDTEEEILRQDIRIEGR